MYLRRIPTKEMTQEEFNKLLEHKNIKGGVNISPYTDLTSIKFFPANSVFGNGCEFGRYSNVEDCIFNDRCEFDKNSTFKDCKFGDRCKFNEDITITNCKFGDGCITRDESLANTHKGLQYKTKEEEKEEEKKEEEEAAINNLKRFKANGIAIGVTVDECRKTRLKLYIRNVITIIVGALVLLVVICSILR